MEAQKPEKNQASPQLGLITIPPADSTRIAPTIGPVQLNDTKTNVKAIKNCSSNTTFIHKAISPVTPTAWKNNFKSAEKRKCKNNEYNEKQDIRYPMGTYPIRKIST